MWCLLPMVWLNPMIVLCFVVVDAQLTGPGLPVAPSTISGNPPYTISESPSYLYPNVTAAPPYNYPNATGTASNPVRNATDSNNNCAGPNGEKGKLRKRMLSVYASSGSPQPSSSAMFVVECSIEVHIQPEASVSSFLLEANEIHVTENHLLQPQQVTEGNLLGSASTSTPTVTTLSAEHLGDTLEMDYGPAKSTSARPTSARTFAPAYNANDLTDLQLSQLHAALQPAQTDMPHMSAQSLQSSSPGSDLPRSSSIAPPQVSSWNGVSISTPSGVLKVPSTDGSSNAALAGGYPTGKPDGAETSKPPNAPNAPKGVPNGASPSGGSSKQSDQGASAQLGGEPSNVGSPKADSAPKSSASGSGASDSGSSGFGSGSGSSSGLGSTTTGFALPGPGSDCLPGSPSSIIPSSGKNPLSSGSAPGSTSGSSNTSPSSGSSSGSTGSSSSPGSGFPDSNKSSSNSGPSPDLKSGSPNSKTGPGALPGSPVSESSGSTSNFVPPPGSGAVPGPGSANGGSIPQNISPPSDSNALRPSSGPSGPGIIAIGSQSYTARQTGSFVVVGSHTIAQGAPAVTIGSTPVSIGGNGVLVAGGDTLELNQAASQTNDIITIGSQTYTAQQAASFFVVGSNTLVKGAPAVTIASVPVSLGANGLLLAGSNTVELGPAPTGGTGPGAAGVIAIGSSSYTIHEAGFSIVLGSITIAPEAPAITIASELVSLATNGVLVAGSNTMTLGSTPTGITGPKVAGVITIGSVHNSVLPTGSGFVVVGSNTISKGAPPITIASEPISLATNGMLMAGSNTLALGSQATGDSNSVPDATLSQGGPVPGPSGNPASKGGLTSNSGSSSNTTGAQLSNAGGVRVWDTVGRWTWTVGAGTVIAIVTCGIL